MRYLITGGAGYVGSHVAQALLDAGHDVTIIDNLSTGHRAAIPVGAHFHHLDLATPHAVDTILSQGPWEAVLHFAALSLVGASMENPYHYLRQNALTSLNLIESCVRHNISRFIFSSTAALFGNGISQQPITQHTPIEPNSPYGESKYFIERALYWAERIHGMRYGCLRYFNAAGADKHGRLGEDHRPETHLIPRAIDAMLGRQHPLKIFGHDYPTKDGTCIRDYIHVSDLAEAHIQTIKQLEHTSVTYNLGSGYGLSNLDIIDSIERVSGQHVPWEWAPKREGDPAILIADSAQIYTDTGWRPTFTHIDDIIETALRWREAHPDGYSS